MVGPKQEARMSARRMLATLAIVAGTGVAAAADLPAPVLVHGPIAIDLPCSSANVLGRIMDRFAWAERSTWHRGFVMQALDNARPSGHPFYEPGIIKRDYCMADSLMTNGDQRTVYFTIEYGVGFASIGNYVDFCVLGLDPWYVHDESCRTVR
jgi:hypothetical protein